MRKELSSRFSKLFQSKSRILSIYLTAGFPKRADTVPVIEALASEGVDFLEIGFPFSDPLADGPVIQQSSEAALKNGMSLTVLFEQLKSIRNSVSIPLLLMGYINPVLQFGVEKFAAMASEVGVDGVIIPDMPLEEYESTYRDIFARYGLHVILFISPTTDLDRMRKIDELSTAFIYAVSSPAVTGNPLTVDTERERYFKQLKGLGFKTPVVIGFGISDKQSFSQATDYAAGAIIGTAFVRALGAGSDIKETVHNFVRGIR